VETTPTPVSFRLLSTTRRSRSGARGNLCGTTSLRTTHDRRFNRLALAPAHMERVAAANVSQEETGTTPAQSQRPSLSGGPARGTLSRWAAVQFAGPKPTKGRPKGPTAPREGGRCQINRSSLHHPYPGTTPLESAHGSGLVGVGVGVGLREADLEGTEGTVAMRPRSNYGVTSVDHSIIGFKLSMSPSRVHPHASPWVSPFRQPK
jgi:hypothetical protein